MTPIAAAAVDRIFAFIKKEQLKVIDMFYKIDVDGSGEIEPTEFVEALAKMGLRLTPAELDAVVYELDVDGDGTVELHEYMHQMKRISKARFSKASTDGSLNFARKGGGWVLGSEGVPWLQPPQYGHGLQMEGRIGRTQANTRIGMKAKNFVPEHTARNTAAFASTQRKYTCLAISTAQAFLRME